MIEKVEVVKKIKALLQEHNMSLCVKKRFEDYGDDEYYIVEVVDNKDKYKFEKNGVILARYD